MGLDPTSSAFPFVIAITIFIFTSLLSLSDANPDQSLVHGESQEPFVETQTDEFAWVEEFLKYAEDLGTSYRPSEDELLKCLEDVRNRLEEDEKVIAEIEREIGHILTVDGDHNFQGVIKVEESLKINSSVSSIDTIAVVPAKFDVQPPLVLPSPTHFQATVLEQWARLNNTVTPSSNVLLTNRGGRILGNLVFRNLTVKKLRAPKTDVELATLNNLPLDEIKEYALPKSIPDHITVTGEWTINKLTTSRVEVASISGLPVDDLLLHLCPNTTLEDEVQDVSGFVTFQHDIYITDGLLMPPNASVNGIVVSDIVLKDGLTNEIRGYKHVKNLKGREGFSFKYVNGKDFPEWYHSVLHLDGPPQRSSGTKTLAALKGDEFINLKPGIVNGRNWNEFYETVLRSVGDQEIEGDVQFQHLHVDNLVIETIGTVRFSDLFSTNSIQTIEANIAVNNLIVKKNLETGLINGIPLMDQVVRRNEDAEILGPLILERCTVKGNVTAEEYVTIGGKDISEIALIPRKQIYYSPRNKPTKFQGITIVRNLETSSLNGHLLNNLHEKYWSHDEYGNHITGPLDLRGRKVKVLHGFFTGTLNYLNLASDVIHVSKDTIEAQLDFTGNVVTIGNVQQSDGRKLNGDDFSELVQKIVRAGDGQTVTGMKEFKSVVIVKGGIYFEKLNNIRIPEDLVLLNASDNQIIGGPKRFKNKVVIKTLSTEVENIEVRGKVNGFNLTELWETTAFKGLPLQIHGPVHFNRSFSASDLHVRDRLNGVNVTDLLYNAVYLNEPQYLRFPIKVQHGEVVVDGPARVESINDVVVDQYLPKVVLRDQAPSFRINGAKTFANVFVEGDLTCERINGINLMELKSHALSLTDPQNITNTMQAQSLIIEGDLKVGRLDGIDSSNLIYIDDPEACTVHSDVVFADGVSVEGSVSIHGSINGHKIGDSKEYKHDHPQSYEYGEIEVDGDLVWNHDRSDIEGISQFLEHAVTLDTDQVITGKVTFAGGFHAENLEALPWIDNVNLEELKEDAISQGDSFWHLEGNNTFLKPLVFQSTLTVEHLSVGRVQGVVMNDIDKLIVRKGSHGTIYGRKTFPKGLTVENLVFNDLNGKGNYSWLVVGGDHRVVDNIEVIGNLIVGGDLNFNKSKGFDFDRILNNRLTRDTNQTLAQNFNVSSLTVENGCNVEYINGIKVSDIFLKNDPSKQIIHGKKTFKESLIFEGELATPNINGYDFEQLYHDVYRKSANEKVHRPLVFNEPVWIMDSIEVKDDVNGMSIDNLKEKISSNVRDIKSRALEYPETKPSAEKLTMIENVKHSLPPSPLWLEHVRFRQNWSLVGPQSRVEYAEFASEVSSGIVGLHWYDVSGREGCVCDTVTFVDIDGPSISAHRDNYFQCQNTFFLPSQSKAWVVYSVVDNSESYNTSCDNSDETQPQLAISLLPKQEEFLALEPSKGFLSDAKTFSVDKTDYLVLSYFFDASSQSHDSFTYVYKVYENNTELIQTVPSSGPVKLALDHLRKQWFLAIANSRNPKDDSCKATSAIYRWDASLQKFVLIREVTTNGALDVVFIEAQDRVRKGSLVFAAFAQSGVSGDGEVIILQYSQHKRKDKFNTVQSIRTPWSVTAVEFVAIRDTSYLITVVPQEGIRFYEYRYIEGFQEALFIPLVGAQDIVPISWGKYRERYLFAVASTKTTLLLEAVIAGNTPPEYDEDPDGYEDLPLSLTYRDST